MTGGRPDSLPRARRIASFFDRRFFIFVLFGGTAAVTSLAAGAVLYSFEPIALVVPYWLAVTLGSVCGLLVNFLLNYRYNFRFRGRTAAAQLRTFSVVAVMGIALTTVLSTSLLTVLRIVGADAKLSTLNLPISDKFAAQFLAVGLTAFFSFWGHRTFSFNVGIRQRIRALLARVTR